MERRGVPVRYRTQITRQLYRPAAPSFFRRPCTRTRNVGPTISRPLRATSAHHSTADATAYRFRNSGSWEPPVFQGRYRETSAAVHISAMPVVRVHIRGRNIAFLVELGMGCSSAWGPEADRQGTLLIYFRMLGYLLGAYLH
jgi:hypothetical protein